VKSGSNEPNPSGIEHGNPKSESISSLQQFQKVPTQTKRGTFCTIQISISVSNRSFLNRFLKKGMLFLFDFRFYHEFGKNSKGCIRIQKIRGTFCTIQISVFVFTKTSPKVGEITDAFPFSS
jgi:hypothetical protein